MTIQRGDYVRPNNPSVGLPQGSVWYVDQLQALAKSYGYRIVKPSMLAQVVKL